MKYKIIIPYRNRVNNLIKIMEILPKYFVDDYEIFVIEQVDGKMFNLGALVNIGFIISKPTDDNVFIQHPVDCYPIDVDYDLHGQDVVHLITPKSNPWTKAFCFHPKIYKIINGYSNDYWGWGGDDHEQNRKSNIFKLNIERRMSIFDETEDLVADGSGKCQNATNTNNISKLHSYSNEHSLNNGLNTISFNTVDVLEIKNNIYKITVEF